jgi:hypothetical protein
VLKNLGLSGSGLTGLKNKTQYCEYQWVILFNSNNPENPDSDNQ